MSSFSFKTGPPCFSNVVTDVRFLPDPKSLEEHHPYITGRHRVVADFLRSHCEFEPFFRELCARTSELMNDLARKGCRRINLAFGCTAGKHRSVFVAEALAQWLRANHQDFTVSVKHRDIPCDLLREDERFDGTNNETEDHNAAGHLFFEPSTSPHAASDEFSWNPPPSGTMAGPMLQCTYYPDQNRIEFSERNRNSPCTSVVHDVLGNGLANLKSLRERRALSTGRAGEELSGAHKIRKMISSSDLSMKQPNSV